jgi:hypothetical protein
MRRSSPAGRVCNGCRAFGYYFHFARFLAAPAASIYQAPNNLSTLAALGEFVMQMCMRLYIGFSALALVAAFAATHYVTLEAAPIQFESAGEVCDLANAGGLIVTHENSASSHSVFFVSDRTLTQDDLLAVATRRDCGKTPGWRGIVWVSPIRAGPGATLFPEFIDGNCRIWGNVVVAGDQDLMDRIEALYRSHSSR